MREAAPYYRFRRKAARNNVCNWGNSGHAGLHPKDCV